MLVLDDLLYERSHAVDIARTGHSSSRLFHDLAHTEGISRMDTVVLQVRILHL